MILYEKKNNMISVYKLTAEEKSLIDFRIQEMENIPENNRALYAKQVYQNFNNRPLFEQYREKLDEHIFPYEKADRRLSSDIIYHILLPYPEDKSEKKELIKRYYDGKYTQQNRGIVHESIEKCPVSSKVHRF